MSPDRLAHLRTQRAPIAIGAGGTQTGQDLCANAEALRTWLAERCDQGAAHLRDTTPRQLLVHCSDRYHFAVALLGAWQAGLSVALPANRATGDNRALAELDSTVAIATDHDQDPRRDLRLPTVDLRSLPARQGSPRSTGQPWTPAPHAQAATLYTSGSTAGPKGIAKRFDQLFGEAALHADHFEFAGATVLCSVPAHHIYGLLWGVLAPLLGGGVFVRETPQLAPEIARAATQTGADLLVAVPAHLQALANLPRLPTSLRRIISSGAPLPVSLAERLEGKAPQGTGGGVPVVEILGSTETGGVASRRTAHSTAWQPLPGVTARADHEGRLWVRSPHADAGPGAESACQDRVRMLPEGGFEHLGRADSVVKVAGRRVDLDALKQRLRGLEGVRDAHVLALPNAGIRGVTIACVLEAPASVASHLDRRAVHNALRAWFDPSALPRRIKVVEQMPRTENGKVAREALVRLFEPGEPDDPPVASDPIRSPGMPPTGGPIFALSPAEPDVESNGFRIEARVLSDAWCFEGHFEGDPTLPGVVQLNNLVVPAARDLWPDIGRLCRAQGLKFKTKIRPGETITMTLARPSGRDADATTTVRFRIERGAELCAGGSLKFAAGSPEAVEAL